MQRQFAQKIEEMRRLIDGSASFLLAVSGGMDSMCMADLFLQTCGADSLAIAHCNFSLRGEESDGDEALVREWAESNGVRIFVKSFDTVAYAGEKRVSIEMAARDLRYGWFVELCREHGFAAVSVAHNANDNAETLMLNLLRGTGLTGLHGMTDISTLSALRCDRNVMLYRPLIEFTRKQIEGYVISHRVPYRHDSSNFSSDYKRNKIRNEVFPVFEKINPSFVRTMNREIGYFAEAGSIVEDWCKARVADVVTVMSAEKESDRPLTIDITALLATPHWRYLLYYILEPYGFNSQTLASLESLLESNRTISGKRFESPTHLLLTGRNALTVLPLKESCSTLENVGIESSCRAMGERSISLCSCSANHSTATMSQGANGGHCLSDDITVVRGAGTYSFNGIRFKVELLPWTGDLPLKQPHGTLLMDADKMRFPFVCRRWRQGDWLVPLGMRGRKKISDLFADLKYDTLAKESAVIMVDTMTEGLAQQQHIAGLLGVRIDDRYKIIGSTTSVIRIIRL